MSVVGQIPLAEKLTSLLWLIFLLSTGISILFEFRKGLVEGFTKYSSIFFDKTEKMLSKRRLIFFFFLLISVVYGFSSTKFMGGDDTRTYFEYPQRYFEYYGSHVATNNAFSGLVGFLPNNAISAFLLHLVVLKKLLPFLNLQSVYFTANILFGYFFFTELCYYLLPKKVKYARVFCSITGILYVFSQFNIYTIYSSQILGLFSVSVFPLVLYLFVRSLEEKRKSFVLFIPILLTIFGAFAAGLPWYAGAFLISLPLFLYLLIRKPIRFIITSLIIVGLYILMNLNWLVFLPHSPVIQKSVNVMNSLSSQEFRDANESGIRSNVAYLNVQEPILNSFPHGLQEAFNWQYTPLYRDWYSKIYKANIFFVMLFVIASLRVRRMPKSRKLFIAVFASYLVALYFFVVNLGSIAVNAFIWMTDKIPGFVMFRNGYDKFAYGYSFIYSLLLMFSFYVIFSQKISKTLSYVLLSISVFVMLLNIKPVLFNEFSNQPIWLTQGTFPTITDFNDDFISLINFIRSHPTDSRYLILPLANGNVLPIQDKYKEDHYYVGVSPLLQLSGQNDYSGFMSFGYLSDELKTYLQESEYEKAADFFHQLNIGYVIVNNVIPYDIQRSYIYPDNILTLQSPEFIHTILGNKVADFGKHYSLYEVKEEYKPKKLFVVGQANADLTFDRVGDYKYHIRIPNSSEISALIFLEPYSDDWELKDSSGKIYLNEHYLANKYANGWNLMKKQSEEIYTLTFKPQSMYLPTFYVSYITLVLILLIGIGLYFKNE